MVELSMINLIVENKDLLKIFYTFVIAVVCLIIVMKTDRLFRLSFHQGIRYFRNAFFFFGIAFTIRFITSIAQFYTHVRFEYLQASTTAFEFFLIMAGFFLLYSLLWKKFENSDPGYASSLFNSRILVFYMMAILIVTLDLIWQTLFFMFASQIVLFVFASAISYNNYRHRGKQHKFLMLYFVAMILSLAAWVLNAFAAIALNWNKGVLINIYLINMIIFLLFLYGVAKVTKRIRG